MGATRALRESELVCGRSKIGTTRGLPFTLSQELP